MPSLRFILRTSLALGGLLVLIFGGGVILDEKRNLTDEFFSNAVRAMGVRETVSVGGREYEVAEGAVWRTDAPAPEHVHSDALRLAFAKTLARRAPSVGIPGTNPATLELAANELEAAALLLAHIQEDTAAGFFVRTSLYPIEFIRSLAEAERARLAFLENGSHQSAQQYYQMMEEVVSSYLRDLARFKNAFSRIVPEDAADYVVAQKTIRREDILEMLGVLEESAHRVHTILDKEWRCVSGYAHSCDTKLVSDFPRQEANPFPVPPAARAVSQSIRHLLTSAGFPIRMDEPTVEIARSACAATKDRVGFFVAYAASPEDAAGNEYLMPVHDLPFVEIERHVHIPFFAYLKGHGITYAPIIDNFYTCPDIGLDYGRVRSVLAVRAFVEHSPLSDFAGTADIFRLKSLEVALSSSQVKESDAVEYIEIARTLVEAALLPEEVENEIRLLAFRISRNTSGLEPLAKDIARIEHASILAYARGIPVELEAPYLFFVRSSVLSFFRIGNTALSGSYAEAIEEPSALTELRPHMLYSSLGTTSALRELLANDTRLYRSVLLDLAHP